MDWVLHVLGEIAAFLYKNNAVVTAIATVFIAVFTIVLAKVTGRQARLTKSIASAAEKSANAAQSQVAQARENTIVEQRAWVFGGPLLSSIKSTSQGDIEFQIVVKNYGKTPARVTEVLIDTANLPPAADNEALCTQTLPGNFPLGPGDVWPVLNLGRTSLHSRYVFGVVRYVDAFGKNRWSRFCGELRHADPRYITAGSSYWSDFDKD